MICLCGLNFELCFGCTKYGLDFEKYDLTIPEVCLTRIRFRPGVAGLVFGVKTISAWRGWMRIRRQLAGALCLLRGTRCLAHATFMEFRCVSSASLGPLLCLLPFVSGVSLGFSKLHLLFRVHPGSFLCLSVAFGRLSDACLGTSCAIKCFSGVSPWCVWAFVLSKSSGQFHSDTCLLLHCFFI